MHDMAPAEQDKPTVDYLALLAEKGWPQIKGGSPELDEESETPDAPDDGQGEGEEESFVDSFNLDEVPEDARPHVEALQKEWQGKYTQKRQADKQEIAEARREAEEARQLQEALRNPQVAPAILSQLGYTEKEVLEMFGYQPEEGEEEFPPDEAERLDRLEQTLAQRDQAEQAAQREDQVVDYISSEIEALEQQAGREFDAEEHRLLDAYARAYAQNGVPDVQGAGKLLTGLLDTRQKEWIESKKTTRPPGGGKPGSRTVDLSKETKEQRMERMRQAAEEAAGSAA